MENMVFIIDSQTFLPNSVLATTTGFMKPNLKTFKVAFFLRWLPVTGSVTLMLMVFLLSAVSFSQLKTANFWREHTYKVLAAAQTFLSDLLCIQGDARNYVFTGKAAVLKTFEERVSSAPQQLTQLKLLTLDNPRQQEHLRPIGSHLDEVIAFSQQLVDTRNTYGIQAAVLFPGVPGGRTGQKRIPGHLEP